MARTATTADVTQEQAATILDASVRKVRELNLLMNVAVVDVGGNLNWPRRV